MRVYDTHFLRSFRPADTDVKRRNRYFYFLRKARRPTTQRFGDCISIKKNKSSDLMRLIVQRMGAVEVQHTRKRTFFRPQWRHWREGFLPFRDLRFWNVKQFITVRNAGFPGWLHRGWRDMRPDVWPRGRSRKRRRRTQMSTLATETRQDLQARHARGVALFRRVFYEFRDEVEDPETHEAACEARLNVMRAHGFRDEELEDFYYDMFDM
eukprot:NODE_2264_length_1100_cov_38.127441_g2246_i0.p1 GENE.NODE_2264_length_1100_cov_38.127441_g2246_i0~~NODE_2264_length_1100_cov_38.127441_g2246_i0.p1  ORF type:complete len:210 (-),score=7.47 NODE_2264_length_1100_cov_38.127441_g2246_i0:373-1002(-)